MPGNDERLTRWWEKLSEQERADALRYQETGRLTDGLQQSLQSAELLQPTQDRPGHVIPAHVHDFLKMRHD
ncbi:MAG: hypothetical protein ACR2FP_03320 [Nocardioidaceae bacterium]